MCLVSSILKGAIYQAICYVVCEQAGALWRWGGKRSAPESLLAGYLQSSLCAVAPSQTRGDDCARAICVIFEICINWSSVV